MVYFGFYHSVKGLLPEYQVHNRLTNLCHVLRLILMTLLILAWLCINVLLQDDLWEFLRKVSIGFVSGTLASCINIPFDVAKSRIQGPQPAPGQIKYQGTFRSIGIVYKEEG